jgi:hypothetical protein
MNTNIYEVIAMFNGRPAGHQGMYKTKAAAEAQARRQQLPCRVRRARVPWGSPAHEVAEKNG